MPQVLIVDDDAHIREVVRFALEAAGMQTREADNGRAALEAFEKERCDLVVLDVLMPELDGTDVCRKLRQTSSVPIVFMSSKDDEIDRVLGLELGGDDYVTKPFSPRELVARVRAVLRRTTPVAATQKNARQVSYRGLSLDLDRYEASYAGKAVVLTATEFGILRTLLSHPGKVYNRQELIEGAHGEEHIVSDRTVDSHMRRVRQKLVGLGANMLETIHGIGYKLEAP
jgi:two-component system, OmpR family, response regulator